MRRTEPAKVVLGISKKQVDLVYFLDGSHTYMV